MASVTLLSADEYSRMIGYFEDLLTNGDDNFGALNAIKGTSYSNVQIIYGLDALYQGTTLTAGYDNLPKASKEIIDTFKQFVDSLKTQVFAYITQLDDYNTLECSNCTDFNLNNVFLNEDPRYIKGPAYDVIKDTEKIRSIFIKMGKNEENWNYFDNNYIKALWTFLIMMNQSEAEFLKGINFIDKLYDSKAVPWQVSSDWTQKATAAKNASAALYYAGMCALYFNYSYLDDVPYSS
jgi:hypothetical protein